MGECIDKFAEMKGQIIDIFEDYLEEKGIRLMNDEHEGDENEAIIYGSHYSEIADVIERAAETDGWNDGKKSTGDRLEHIAVKILFKVADLVRSYGTHGLSELFDDRNNLIAKVLETLVNWDLKA